MERSSPKSRDYVDVSYKSGSIAIGNQSGRRPPASRRSWARKDPRRVDPPKSSSVDFSNRRFDHHSEDAALAALDSMHESSAPYAGERVIFCIDQDCFYAQVVMRERPELRKIPLGITQKYLVVTCNYPARARGVSKLMGIDSAQEACPELVLVPGEDLSIFRSASEDIFEEFKAFFMEVARGLANLAAKEPEQTTCTRDRDGDFFDDEEEEHDHQQILMGNEDGAIGSMNGLIPEKLARRIFALAKATRQNRDGGVVLERNGLDEVFVDCTVLCHVIMAVREFMSQTQIDDIFALQSHSSPDPPGILQQLLNRRRLPWKGHLATMSSSKDADARAAFVDHTASRADSVFAIAAAVCDAIRQRLKVCCWSSSCLLFAPLVRRFPVLFTTQNRRSDSNSNLAGVSGKTNW